MEVTRPNRHRVSGASTPRTPPFLRVMACPRQASEGRFAAQFWCLALLRQTNVMSRKTLTSEHIIGPASSRQQLKVR